MSNEAASPFDLAVEHGALGVRALPTDVRAEPQFAVERVTAAGVPTRLAEAQAAGTVATPFQSAAWLAAFDAVMAPALAASTEVADRASPDARTKRTRFIIGLDKRVKYTVSTLSAPNRVIVEMEDANIELPTIPENQAVGIVKSLRSGISGPGRLSVVIDVTTPVVVEKTHLEKAPEGTHYHLALEIAPVQLTLPRSAKLGSLDSNRIVVPVEDMHGQPVLRPKGDRGLGLDFSASWEVKPQMTAQHCRQKGCFDGREG